MGRTQVQQDACARPRRAPQRVTGTGGWPGNPAQTLPPGARRPALHANRVVQVTATSPPPPRPPPRGVPCPYSILSAKKVVLMMIWHVALYADRVVQVNVPPPGPHPIPFPLPYSSLSARKLGLMKMMSCGSACEQSGPGGHVSHKSDVMAAWLLLALPLLMSCVACIIANRPGYRGPGPGLDSPHRHLEGYSSAPC